LTRSLGTKKKQRLQCFKLKDKGKGPVFFFFFLFSFFLCVRKIWHYCKTTDNFCHKINDISGKKSLELTKKNLEESPDFSVYGLRL